MSRMKMKHMPEVYKFEIGQIVVVGGIACTVKDREYYDGCPDYLVYALEGSPKIRGNDTANGAGWCYEHWLTAKARGES